MKRVLVVALALGCFGCAQDGVVKSSGTDKAIHEAVVKSPAWRFLDSYEPTNPASLDEIPQDVRERVVKHLRSRLGDDFFERLRFTGGQVVDFEELYRVYPRAKNYKWTVHAYDLHFEFTLPSKGIESYTAQIQLNSDGSVLEEINLPAFAKHPEKLNFVSLAKIEDVAAKAGYDVPEADIELEYDSELDSIVWRLTEAVAVRGAVTDLKVIEIDAHSGRVVRQYENQAIE